MRGEVAVDVGKRSDPPRSVGRTCVDIVGTVLARSLRRRRTRGRPAGCLLLVPPVAAAAAIPLVVVVVVAVVRREQRVHARARVTTAGAPDGDEEFARKSLGRIVDDDEPRASVVCARAVCTPHWLGIFHAARRVTPGRVRRFVGLFPYCDEEEAAAPPSAAAVEVVGYTSLVPVVAVVLTGVVLWAA